MKAWKIAAGAWCCLILANGCRTCESPYDDCGPVWSQGACLNCNPDYRAGSVLNRREPGMLTADDLSQPAEPPPRPARTPRVASHRSDGSESQVRATAVGQQRRTPKHAPAERQAAQASPESTVLPEAPSPKDLPAGTVAAPPGTKEGATRILSVTDRRLDELQKAPRPMVDQPKALQRIAEKSNQRTAKKSSQRTTEKFSQRTAEEKPSQRSAEKPSEDFGGWRPVTSHQDAVETATASREIDR